MYPSFVGVGSTPYVLLYVTSFVVTDTIPPFGFNVTVYLFPSYFAYNTILSVIATFVVLSIFSFPIVYQPLNVIPTFVGVGSTPYVLLYDTVFVVLAEPLLYTNVTI